MSPTKTQRDSADNLTAEPARSPYLTARETVAYLRLGSLRALTRLIVDHRLPYGRRGRIYLFDIRKLDRWVESRGVELRAVDGGRGPLRLTKAN